MKKSIFRILTTALAVAMMMSALCGTTFATTANPTDILPAETDQFETLAPPLAPPVVMVPVLDEDESNNTVKDPNTPVTLPPAIPAPVMSSFFGIVPAFEHNYYDYNLETVVLVFEWSDASKLGFLYEIAEPALRLTNTLENAKKHLDSDTHNPVCIDPQVEWELQKNLQDMNYALNTDFSVLSFQGMINEAERLMRTEEFKALTAALAPLKDQQHNSSWTLTMNFTAEELASYHNDLMAAASYFWPDEVAAMEHTRFGVPVPVGVGFDVETISESACD